MEKYLRPERLDCNPNSPSAPDEWRHWHRTLLSFLRALGDREINKLDTLVNFLSPMVYKYVAELTTYEEAIAHLETLYVKPKNEIFARHLLSTRKQQTSESIDEYLQELRQLSKDCCFKPVTAEQYRDQYIRDSFISGLASPVIRQRLLENKTLDLDTAVAQARSLTLAQQSAESYVSQSPLACNAATPGPKTSDQDDLISAAALPGAKKDGRRCWNCDGPFHGSQRWKCPAKDSICSKCSKRGHYAKVCRGGAPRPVSASTTDPNPTLAITFAAATLGSLSDSTTAVTVGPNLHTAQALIDSGSSDSFISDSFVKKHNITVTPFDGQVSMAQLSLSSSVVGLCTTTIHVGDTAYGDLRLRVLPSLCSDIVLGLDFMRQHKGVKMEFGGTRDWLELNKTQTSCSLVPAAVESPRLFSNLTQDCRPIATKSRRYSHEDRTFIDAEVKRLLSDGVIEPSNSPWRAQIVVDKPENHKKRLCIDYSRTINRFTQLDAYPLPRIHDMVTKLAGYKVYSTLDLKSAYHQIPIREEEKAYTAFEGNGKLYQFCRVPFGVTNGVAVFQRTINDIIDNNKLKDTFAYVDNITIAGVTQEEHDFNLQRFLEVATKHNLTFNENKSIISTNSINLLGYTVSHGELKPDPERIRPLKELPLPTNQAALNRVRGFFSHYSHWVSCFSDKIRLLANPSSFPLSKEAADAFENLKQEIIGAVVTSIDENIPFTVETDTSDFALAGTLTQRGHPVAFFARTLHGPETRHVAVEKEAAAIVESLDHWRHYLAGRHFTLVTDQRSVSYMFDNRRRGKIKNEKIQRWRMELSCFNYDIIYRPGKNNLAADTLTRAFCNAINLDTLSSIHEALCHPGVVRLAHFVRTRNLPYSMNDVKRVCSSCTACAKLKPHFYRPEEVNLVKATQPWERISLDFKGPL